MNRTDRDYAELAGENSRLREALRTERQHSVIYTHIAHALTRDYTDLFYVNMETDEYIEYHTDDDRGVLVESRRASDFFESCAREAKLYVHPEEQEKFVQAMNRQFLMHALSDSRFFEMSYRRIKNGRTFYVQMKVSRMTDDPRFIVIAVSDIDELVKKRKAEEKIQEERIIYARLHAITGNFIVIYVVDPVTGTYREFSSTDGFAESFRQAKEGRDFFRIAREKAAIHNDPADLNRFLAVFTKENVLKEIEANGIFTFGYCLLMNGKPLHVQMKAAMVEEKDGPQLIVGINDIDAQVRQEEEMEHRLLQAQSEANIDALTGVRNRHAYLEEETRMDRLIAANKARPFAVVVMDLNDLKKINDTCGHQFGDQYLCDACRIICDTFRHSPVFRIGGDEFAVIAQGQDYQNIKQRQQEMDAHNEAALKSNGIVIACGMSEFRDDPCVAAVFERADHAMYENKNRLKALHAVLAEANPA